MMPAESLWLLMGIGFGAGVLSGVFGIGGGVVIVPALIYFVGFRQHLATGTSLAVLLPPVGLGAVLAYYRTGNVDMPAAGVLAITLTIGGYVGAVMANRLSGPYLRLWFGVFVLILGISLVIGALRRLVWL